MKGRLLLIAICALAITTAHGDSLNCRFIGSWPFGPSYAVALDSSRNLAFCGGGGGVFVLDVSDPTLPVKRSEISTSGLVVWGLCYLNNRLYVADDNAGLRVISVSDPANPVEVGFYDTPGRANDVAVVGDYAYVADGGTGLRVISVSDPAHPVEVGFCDTPGYAYGAAKVGNYAYVADGDGLRIISVSDPAHPTEVGFYETPDWAQRVAVVGDYAYVADYDAGLRVISVTDPAHPTEVGFYVTLGWTHGVAKVGDYAYVADDYAGLRVIAVSDPAHPTEVGSYDTPGEAYGVAVVGNYAYVADYNAGLQIYQFYGAGVEETPNDEVRSTNAIPTVVRSVLFLPDAVSGERLAVSAWLLDISGRKVADLHPGANDVSRFGTGVYFVRDLGTQGRGAVRRVVLAR